MITLTLKKVFFQQVAKGEKTIEYRVPNPYYERMFATNPKRVMFHFYRAECLICDIEKIELIPKPEHLATAEYLRGHDQCWAIHLANPILSTQNQSGRF